MKSFATLVVFVWSISASQVEARIGETLAQCVERYGPVVEREPATVKESDPDQCTFTKSGITAAIEFKGGIAWRIVFRMLGMTSAEAETLLKANMPDGGWGAALKINAQEFRLSFDRRRIAVYSPTKTKGEITTLEIATRDYATASYAAYSAKVNEAVSNMKAPEAGNALKGF